MSLTHSPRARSVERSTPATGSVADHLRPLVESLVGEVPIRIVFWDGSSLGSVAGPGTIHVRSADAVKHLVWAPGELGLGRAFVAGDIDVDGDLLQVIRLLRPAEDAAARRDLSVVPAAVRAARRLGIVSGPPPRLPEEAHPHGRRHSRSRDRASVTHHYDVGNDFYRIVLGEAMTYSCARFVDPPDTLEVAQAAKHELICRKLGLHERRGMRLLDVGCGWGSMAMHAARHHDAQVVGITISREQAEHARGRVAEAGLEDRVEIRLQDYRDIRGQRFDAISSIGMFEHVGKRRMEEYFTTLRGALVRRGRLLNHAISSPGGSRLGRRTFTYRFVFPDGELLDVGDVALAMEAAGLEVRDVESLREHYSLTLRRWIDNLQQHWDEAVRLVGERRARVWLLYMSGSALGFDNGHLALHQVLAVAPDDDGTSGMPSTRRTWD